MTRFRLTLLVLLLPHQIATGQGVRRSLWVDSERMDLTDPKVVARILNQPVQRLIVSCFVGGESLYPNQSDFFPQMPGYRGKPDVLEALLQKAHEKGIAVAVFIDCLHWTLPGASADRDLFERHPTFAERSFARDFGDPKEGKFASPFNPRVRESLQLLVRELATRYPSLNGLVLRCRLSPSTLLGFSKGARAAYIAARPHDPLSLDPANPAHAHFLADWFKWRDDQVAELVRELGQTCRAVNPKATISALAQADFYEHPKDKPNYSLQNVLLWMSASAVDEAIVDFGDQPFNPRGVALYTEAAARLHRRAQVSVLLPLRLGESKPYLPAQLRALHGEEITALVVRASQRDDLDAADYFWTKTLPKVEPLLPRTDLQRLEDDPRLQVKISRKIDGLRIEEILLGLEKATRVRMTSIKVDANRPIFAGWSFENLPAWEVMRTIALADSVQGRWEREEDHYRLVGAAKESPPPGYENEPYSPISFFLVFGLVGIVILALNYLPRVLLRNKKTPDGKEPKVIASKEPIPGRELGSVDPHEKAADGDNATSGSRG